MIDSIRIQNFKCLQDVTVELEPFTVLIGPNDSGKTSFFDAISFLVAALRQNQAGSLMQSLIWQKKSNIAISWHLRGEFPDPFAVKTEISVDGVIRRGEWKDQQEAMLSFLKFVGSDGAYHLNPQLLRKPSQAEVASALKPSGENLASVVLSLLAGPDRQTIASLEASLHDEIPSIKGISTPVAPGQPGFHVLEYTLSGDAKPPITIPVSQVSDGAVLLTAFLALAYGNTPQLLMIEEPENGLHPSRLKKVIDILRKMSTGEIGNQPRQIIITTHSPLLLNFVKPEEIRIFDRDESGATQVTAMDRVPNIERLEKEFAPGELWYLFGEEELVKGQPA